MALVGLNSSNECDCSKLQVEGVLEKKVVVVQRTKGVQVDVGGEEKEDEGREGGRRQKPRSCVSCSRGEIEFRATRSSLAFQTWEGAELSGGRKVREVLRLLAAAANAGGDRPLDTETLQGCSTRGAFAGD